MVPMSEQMNMGGNMFAREKLSVRDRIVTGGGGPNVLVAGVRPNWLPWSLNASNSGIDASVGGSDVMSIGGTTEARTSTRFRKSRLLP